MPGADAHAPCRRNAKEWTECSSTGAASTRPTACTPAAGSGQPLVACIPGWAMTNARPPHTTYHWPPVRPMGCPPDIYTACRIPQLHLSAGQALAAPAAPNQQTLQTLQTHIPAVQGHSCTLIGPLPALRSAPTTPHRCGRGTGVVCRQKRGCVWTPVRLVHQPYTKP